jgi:hypothetical protein
MSEMSVLILGRHVMWSRPDGRGGTITYYYSDEITWIVGALALAWLTWFFVGRYMRARRLRRRPPPSSRADEKLLQRIVKLKNELSARYLLPGFSANIHGVGVGMLRGTSDYCLQIFISDARQELWRGAGAAGVPNNYRGVPVVLIEMPVAGFLSDSGLNSLAADNQFTKGIREHQEVIIGGISGANSNLLGQSGTIGYFCTRRSTLPRRREIHLLSNSHVFADLRKAKVDDGDLIMQPSPGELANNRPIGSLVNFSALKFDGDTGEPNQIDAAIAKLWGTQQHKPVIPLIGAVKGYVARKDIRIGEAARKFGRTTGYTEGSIFSIYLDIWIRYDRTGQSAFFQNQFLIEPSLPKFTKYVSKGDSGSLVIDAQQHALGLIFAGTSQMPESLQVLQDVRSGVETNLSTVRAERIEGYGVANPISEVLERLKIELLI